MVSGSYVHVIMLPREEGANSGAGTNDIGIYPKETEEGVPRRALEILDSIYSN